MHITHTVHAHTHTCTHTRTHTRTHIHTHTAIAANDVDDVRPVLDFYKSRGEKHILETFRANQERLQEEDMERERLAQRSTERTVGGPISTFSFGTFSRSSKQQQGGKDSSALPSDVGRLS